MDPHYHWMQYGVPYFLRHLMQELYHNLADIHYNGPANSHDTYRQQHLPHRIQNSMHSSHHFLYQNTPWNQQYYGYYDHQFHLPNYSQQMPTSLDPFGQAVLISNQPQWPRYQQYSQSYNVPTRNHHNGNCEELHQTPETENMHYNIGRHVATHVNSANYNHQTQNTSLHEASTEWRNSPRYWKVLDSKRRISNGNMKISVMSYNVLSQSLLEDHPYLYGNCSRRNLAWSVRWPALIRQIKHHNADIMCLQEVEDEHWKGYFQPMLEKYGYVGFFLKRSGSKPDGCALIFKEKKFKLVEFVPVEFQRSGILDRDNVGAILSLKPKDSYYSGITSKICVATTHLLFNPRRGDVKLAQLMLFLAEIEKCAFLDNVTAKNNDTANNLSSSENERLNERHPYCPIILCGDMNFEPESDLYNFITKGHLHYSKCTSQELSGQQEGWGRGSYNLVPSKLLPDNLDINDHCQFIQHTLTRQSPRVPNITDSHVESNHVEQLTCPNYKVCQDSLSHHNGNDTSSPVDSQGETSTKTQNEKTDFQQINVITQKNNGVAHHNFNFQSVYPHHSKYKKLATTFHSRAFCIVDYIFYSSGESFLLNAKDTTSSQNSTEKKRKFRQNSDTEIVDPKRVHQSKHETDLSESDHTDDEESKCSGLSEASERDTRPPVLDSDIDKTSQDGQRRSGLDFNENCQTTSSVKDASSSVKTLELLSYWMLLTEAQLKPLGTLPNHIFPSDHTCLIAKFVLH